jgi:phosphatidylglycerophosphate synthase
MESIKELRKICQDIEETDYAFFALLARMARFFSIYFTWVFLHFKRITANKITIIGTILFVLGTLCYIAGEYWLNFAGIFLILIGFILDFTDGEVARYQGLAEGTGAVFFEPFSHDIKYAALFAPLTLGAYQSFPHFSVLVLGFSALVFKMLFRFNKLRYAKLVSSLSPKNSKVSSFPKKMRTINKIYVNIAGDTPIIFFLFILTIIDKVYLLLIFYGFLFPAVYFAKLFKQYKQYKKIIK